VSQGSVDYDFIENVFKQTVKNLDGTISGQKLIMEFDKLREDIPNFKAFLVFGGSYAERMMTVRSDLDFWIVLHGDVNFRIKKVMLNKIFRKAIVEPAFVILKKKYPKLHPCGSSVRNFIEFTEQVLRKKRERWGRCISAGLKVITFGRVIRVDRTPFGSKSDYVQLRNTFRQFWMDRGIDILEDIWPDITKRLERTCANLKRYKGKTLYRNLQLPINQMSEAYGFPEKKPEALSLEHKLLVWTGRPRFVRGMLSNLIPIIRKMREKDLRVSQLDNEEYSRLKKELELFVNNMYKPFRRWFRLSYTLRDVLEKNGVDVNYIGICKTHTYLIFSKENPFVPIKGVDLEQGERKKLVFFANLGRTNKRIATLLKNEKFQLVHEEKVNGEVVHSLGYLAKRRTHVILGEYEEDELISITTALESRLMRDLRKLSLYLQSFIH